MCGMGRHASRFKPWSVTILLVYNGVGFWGCGVLVGWLLTFKVSMLPYRCHQILCHRKHLAAVVLYRGHVVFVT